MDEGTVKRIVEALLLSSGEPLSTERIAATLPAGVDVARALSQIASDYASRSLILTEVAGGWTVRTKPENSDLCRHLLSPPVRLTKAAMETLAVIAYFQPITRSEIERVRGVSLAKGTVDLLLWAGLIRSGPRRESAGNPMTFLTTESFLRHFDIGSIEDLPGVEELRQPGITDSAVDRMSDLRDQDPGLSSDRD